MHYVVVRLKTLKDLLLRNPDCIYKYKDNFFSAIVASEYMVVYLAKDDPTLSGFIKLETDLRVTKLDLPKIGHKPIIEVESIMKLDGLGFLD